MATVIYHTQHSLDAWLDVCAKTIRCRDGMNGSAVLPCRMDVAKHDRLRR